MMLEKPAGSKIIQTLLAPLDGIVMPLAEVPDPVFSAGLAGPGCAIDPLTGRLCAPCDGTITQLARTGHAVTLTAAAGTEILVHIGVDTVKLNGEGFTPRVAQGERVRSGQILIDFDLDALSLRAKSLLTIVTVANVERFSLGQRAAPPYARVRPGDLLMEIAECAANPPASAAAGNTATVEVDAVVKQSGGLHARPAARVRQAVTAFSSTVKLAIGEKHADARSVVGLMGLGLRENDPVRVIGQGSDAAAAVAAVVAVLQTRVGADGHAGSSPARATPAPPESVLETGVLSGICAAPGIAIGRAVHHKQQQRFEIPTRGESPARETVRLDHALGVVAAAISSQVSQARRQGRASQGDIFDAHLALLNDPEIIGGARSRMARGASAAAAWRDAVEAQCRLLADLGHSLIAERITDLRDIERRVLVALGVASAIAPQLPADAVVIADDLTPSELSAFDSTRLKALCLIRGGITSHVAIIARAMEVPTLVAVGGAAWDCAEGVEVIVDADRGRFEFQPTAASLAAVRHHIVDRQRQFDELRAAAQKPALTLDGHQIEVAANIADAPGAHAAFAAGADAVGLLRTELLFLDRESEPDENEQRASYAAILDAMGERPVIIRTLDVGGDKPVSYLPFPDEPNPALGLRGVRISTAHPKIFEQQLRALLLLRRPDTCRIMLPMIAEPDEIASIRARLQALAAELGVGRIPQLGAMIEIPSAALLAEHLARHADFLSIGTNDLTQYALAMDRGHSDLAARLDGLHPAVLQLIARTVAGASKHGIWVGVCGALASDPDAVAVLIGLGVAELSVDPPSIARIKARVRKLDHAQCRAQAGSLLELGSAAAVRSRVRALWPA